MRRKKVVSIICTVAISMTMTGCGVLDNLFSVHTENQPIIVQQERLDESDMVNGQVDAPDDGAETTQTGVISIARAGKITRYADTEALKKVLAKYYMGNQQRVQARELLEAGYQLEQDEEVYQMLQALTVNAAEEQDIAEQLDLLLQNLDIPEYANESISMLFSDEWFQAMKPATNRGKRSYY